MISENLERKSPSCDTPSDPPLPPESPLQRHPLRKSPPRKPLQTPPQKKHTPRNTPPPATPTQKNTNPEIPPPATPPQKKTPRPPPPLQRQTRNENTGGVALI